VQKTNDKEKDRQGQNEKYVDTSSYHYILRDTSLTVKLYAVMEKPHYNTANILIY